MTNAIRHALVFAAGLACIMAGAFSAYAGAWTQPKGDIQIISTITYSQADKSFDNSGGANVPVIFDKFLTQSYIEYGLLDSVTLILDPEYAIARSGYNGGPVSEARAPAIEAGARYRVFDDWGIFSVQASYKTAGAFDTSVSVNQESGHQVELRALYGFNFKILGKDSFADIELGERFIAGARPNETPIDLTVGMHVTPQLMILAQNFNIIAGGDAEPPYSYYRTHKVELSAVQHLWHGFSLQLGGFISPAGQNALQERGVALAVWDHF